MIKLEHITKQYGDGSNKVNALVDISLQIERGEFVAITGPSGCGKSTLLNILGGMDRQTAGEYSFEDIEVCKLKEKELARFRNQHIGFVFQAFHLMKELNILDNVAVPLGYAKVGKRERRTRAKELLEQVGLLAKYKSYPAQLSGGEMQRVAVARALSNCPQVLLADEPTGNLDHENGKRIMEMLCKLNREGMTIIMVTHDQELAAMAGRRICMADGKIVEGGGQSN